MDKGKTQKREVIKLGMKKSHDFKNWEVGANYKCEKVLGQGSYGQVAQAT